jgi:hypothetical protein
MEILESHSWGVGGLGGWGVDKVKFRFKWDEELRLGNPLHKLRLRAPDTAVGSDWRGGN